MSRGKHRQTDATDAKARSSELRSWLSRPSVAALLHVTEEQVEQMHGRELHPQRAADRSWRYSPSEVSLIAFGGTADGAVAAKVFALFEKKVTLQKVVIETQQTPEAVMALRAKWDRMAETELSSEIAFTLHRVFGREALASSETLLAAIEAHGETRYVAGFREGQEDANDWGEVINPKTGERRKVQPPPDRARPRPPDRVDPPAPDPVGPPPLDSDPPKR